MAKFFKIHLDIGCKKRYSGSNVHCIGNLSYLKKYKIQFNRIQSFGRMSSRPIINAERESLIAQALEIPEGREVLARSIIAPIRRSMEYNAIGRSLLMVDELPQGAVARYEVDLNSSAHMYEVSTVGIPADRIAFSTGETFVREYDSIYGDTRGTYADTSNVFTENDLKPYLINNVKSSIFIIDPNEEVEDIVDNSNVFCVGNLSSLMIVMVPYRTEVPVPLFEIAANPMINLSGVRARRFEIIERANIQALSNIQADEDRRIFTSIENTVAWGRAMESEQNNLRDSRNASRRTNRQQKKIVFDVIEAVRGE